MVLNTSRMTGRRQKRVVCPTCKRDLAINTMAKHKPLCDIVGAPDKLAREYVADEALHITELSSRMKGVKDNFVRTQLRIGLSIIGYSKEDADLLIKRRGERNQDRARKKKRLRRNRYKKKDLPRCPSCTIMMQKGEMSIDGRCFHCYDRDL